MQVRSNLRLVFDLWNLMFVLKNYIIYKINFLLFSYFYIFLGSINILIWTYHHEYMSVNVYLCKTLRKFGNIAQEIMFPLRLGIYTFNISHLFGRVLSSWQFLGVDWHGWIILPMRGFSLAAMILVMILQSSFTREIGLGRWGALFLGNQGYKVGLYLL